MGWGDKVNIVASLILQSEHHCGHFISRNFLTATLMADVKVLAEKTPQVAMGKKNGAGAVVSDQWIFFSEMRVVAGHPGEFAGFTGACFAGKSINAALSGTKDTGF